jgi:hypothetical protein
VPRYGEAPGGRAAPVARSSRAPRRPRRHRQRGGGRDAAVGGSCSAYAKTGNAINRPRITMKIIQQTIASLGSPMWIEPLGRSLTTRQR